MKKQNLKKGLVAVAAVAAYVINGHAQSVDSLLDKLVDKGVLSVKEAQQLREESDKDFTKAYAAKSGMAEWVSALKFSGDVRGRYENFTSDNNAFVSQDRFRYRLRFGVTATLADDFEAGFRLTSSQQTGGSGGNAGAFGGDPISGNTTFGDNGSKKFIYIDQAYGKWSPLKGPYLSGSVTVGKMENPFVFSDMVFDADYTPEGFALQSAYRFNDVHTVQLIGGGFVLDEIGTGAGASSDPYLFGGQARLDSAWSDKLKSTAGVAGLVIGSEENLLNGSVPNVNRGNTRTGTTAPQYEFNPIIADAAVTYSFGSAPLYAGPFPVKVGGDYMINPAAPRSADNYAYSAGITFGKAGKRHTWEASYTWKYLGANAWWEELVDSDFGAYYGGTLANSGLTTQYGSGTGVKGHIVKLAYSPSDSLTLSGKWFLTDLINPLPAGSESMMSRLQVDAVWKF
jgi:hypothetical protein